MCGCLPSPAQHLLELSIPSEFEGVYQEFGDFDGLPACLRRDMHAKGLVQTAEMAAEGSMPEFAETEVGRLRFQMDAETGQWRLHDADGLVLHNDAPIAYDEATNTYAAAVLSIGNAIGTAISSGNAAAIATPPQDGANHDETQATPSDETHLLSASEPEFPAVPKPWLWLQRLFQRCSSAWLRH